jgi:hypothetical protein
VAWLLRQIEHLQLQVLCEHLQEMAGAAKLQQPHQQDCWTLQQQRQDLAQQGLTQAGADSSLAERQQQVSPPQQQAQQAQQQQQQQQQCEAHAPAPVSDAPSAVSGSAHDAACFQVSNSEHVPSFSLVC